MRTSLFVAGAIVSGSMLLVPLLTDAAAYAVAGATTTEAVTVPDSDFGGKHPAPVSDSSPNRLASRVPEPTTLLMLGAGLLLVARRLNKPVERARVRRR
jgi:hypothetical protein